MGCRDECEWLFVSLCGPMLNRQLVRGVTLPLGYNATTGVRSGQIFAGPDLSVVFVSKLLKKSVKTPPFCMCVCVCVHPTLCDPGWWRGAGVLSRCCPPG